MSHIIDSFYATSQYYKNLQTSQGQYHLVNSWPWSPSLPRQRHDRPAPP